MNHKLITLLTALCAASAQPPDAFTGTWKLNAQKSTFTMPADTYREGTRSYAPIAGGVRVTFNMLRADGSRSTDAYTTQCGGGKCTSSQANWKQLDSRTVEGETFANGKRDARYTRTVSADGKTMTITFYSPVGSKKQPTAVQVWEKQ